MCLDSTTADGGDGSGAPHVLSGSVDHTAAAARSRPGHLRRRPLPPRAQECAAAKKAEAIILNAEVNKRLRRYSEQSDDGETGTPLPSTRRKSASRVQRCSEPSLTLVAVLFERSASRVEASAPRRIIVLP